MFRYVILISINLISIDLLQILRMPPAFSFAVPCCIFMKGCPFQNSRKRPWERGCSCPDKLFQFLLPLLGSVNRRQSTTRIDEEQRRSSVSSQVHEEQRRASVSSRIHEEQRRPSESSRIHEEQRRQSLTSRIYEDQRRPSESSRIIEEEMRLRQRSEGTV